MNATFKEGLTQFWFHVQEGLFPFLSEINVEMTSPLMQVATVLGMNEIE